MRRFFILACMLVLVVFEIKQNQRIQHLERAAYMKGREIMRLEQTLSLIANGHAIGEALRLSNHDWFGPDDPKRMYLSKPPGLEYPAKEEE